jgi:predicted nucleotidyltransferase
VRSRLLEELAAKLSPVFRKYGVLRAIAFGSLARGDESRRSDLDLIVIQDTDKRFLDRYEGILSDVTATVRGRDVDLLIYTPDELERMSERRFIKTALNEGIVLYEQDR